jgi:uncharacterized protein YjbI with pentapeptide repeats
VNTTRGLLVLCAGALILAACGDANSQDSAAAAPLQTDSTAVPELISEDETPDTETLLAEVFAECQTATSADLAGEDLDQRIFLDRPTKDLRCANLTGARLVNASAGVSAPPPQDTADRKADFSGASFVNADLSNATLSIVAVGADFTGADLRGVDFTNSDLRGALFVGALLEGSAMTTFPDGLERADLTGASLGCNVIVASPRMTFTGVTISDECGASSSYQWRAMTLTGNPAGSLMDGFDFTSVVVDARNFHSASLVGANISDKGVFPDGAIFTSADLTGANLSATGFHGAVFENANLSGANLTDTYFESVVANGAVFVDATMTGFQDVNGSYANVDFSGATLDLASLTGTNLVGADLRTTSRVDLVLDSVSCPSANSSLRSLGTCNFEAGS